MKPALEKLRTLPSMVCRLWAWKIGLKVGRHAQITERQGSRAKPENSVGKCVGWADSSAMVG